VSKNFLSIYRKYQCIDHKDQFSGTFLKKYGTSDPKYWNQIKGRVYTKFSKNKVAEFSESGLYNFISLFITLAITADITNVVS